MPRAPRVTFLLLVTGLSPGVLVPLGLSRLTIFLRGVELLDGVIQADPEGGEADLPLQACGEPAVQFHGPFSLCQRGDSPQDALIPNAAGGRAFALDLEMRKVQVRGRRNSPMGAKTSGDIRCPCGFSHCATFQLSSSSLCIPTSKYGGWV